MPKILIVEDEAAILMALEDDLRLEGYSVTGVKNGIVGFEHAREGRYDVIIRSEPSLERAAFGDVEVDFKGYEVRKTGAPVELTAKEFSLLRLLVSHPDEVLERGTILTEVWGDDFDIFPRTVDTHIAHLRKKIEDDPADPKYIVNVRGVGYKFVPDRP